ncbi:hypothetical protein XH96_30205 [Bradyrhizobium sp. CCBAU 51765]|nr:hypothetical protein XH96_30205 [Bradyrhizobium sp. CCBAU 51765]
MFVRHSSNTAAARKPQRWVAVVELRAYRRFVELAGGSHLIGADMVRLKLLRRSALLAASLVLWGGNALGRDDGRYANSPLKPWFDSLRSQLGPCCSDADGFAVADPDWESHNGRYRVRLDGQWIDVPDEAVITEPNRAGRTMVWPVKTAFGISIRCFMPGSMI